MARWLTSAVLAVTFGVRDVAAQAEDPVTAAATAAGVDATKLTEALLTVGETDPYAYLRHTGELPIPQPSQPGWPIGGALGARIYCIEGRESTHGLHMWNPTPVGREHAQGWLGWLPSTAAVWGVTIGNRHSEWHGAAAILARGERFAQTQFATLRYC